MTFINTVKALAGAACISLLPIHNAAAIPVDLELQLLVDVSGSIDTGEFDLQRDGYANAFRDADIQSAITGGGGIAVQLVYWSSASRQEVAVDWTLVDSVSASEALADSIAAAGRPFNGSTAPGTALNFGVPLFNDNGFEGLRNVIDISGDGIQNSGAAASLARDSALASGIDTINGLVIGGSQAVFDFYENNIVGGSDAFIETAANFSEVAAAIDRKIFREIVVGVPEPAALGLLGLGLIGSAWFGRRRS